MSQLEREKAEIPCPGGGRSIRTTYGELARNSSLRSSKGHEYRFKSGDQVRFRRSMAKIEKLKKAFERDLERATQELSQAFQDVIGNADVIIKK